MPPNRKRKPRVKAEPTTDSSPPPNTKPRKLKNQQPHRTPSSFWDNLSRLWLTPRALQEFDRRTVWPAAPVPSERTGKDVINLTKLKRFAGHGGPSLDDLRGYPDPETSAPSHPTMDLSQSGSRNQAETERESNASSSTRRNSAYSPVFKQHLNDHGIYSEEHDDSEEIKEPANIEDINRRLMQRRPSLSPSRFSRKEFLEFRQRNWEASTESKVMSTVIPIITGTTNIPSQENNFFGNLKDLTDGSITKAKPNFHDGSRPTELNKQVREQLSEYIEPSTKKDRPLLPNFFLEGKGPDGSAPICKLQAMYDGALGARGIHKLQSYIRQETLFDNNAYTITSTYHQIGVLTMYTTHPTASKSLANPTEYHMTELSCWHMTGNPDTFRQGASALRNARDWAKKKREKLIAAANGKVPDAEHSDLVSSTQSFTSQPSNEPTQSESETSIDELALDVDTTNRHLK